MSLLSVLNFLLSKDLEGSYSQTFSCYGTLCPFLWRLENGLSMTTVSFSRQESTHWWPKTVNCRHFSDHYVIFGCKNVTVLPPASTLHLSNPSNH